MKKKGGRKRLVITQAPQINLWGEQVLQLFDGKQLKTYHCNTPGSRFSKHITIEYINRFMQGELIDSRPAKIGDTFNIYLHANKAPGIVHLVFFIFMDIK